jgi:hypothetical protein
MAGSDGFDCSAFREIWAVKIGESLREIDRFVLVGECGHLGEDRRAEWAQAIAGSGYLILAHARSVSEDRYHGA